MPTWLITLIPYVWKFLKHWGIYLLLTVLLVGGPYLLYRKGYNDGWKSRVCPPTTNVESGGEANTFIYNTEDFKWLGFKAKLLWLNIKLGY